MRRCDRGFTLIESLLALSLCLIGMSMITSLFYVISLKGQMEREVGNHYSLKEAIMNTEELTPHTFQIENSKGRFRVAVNREEVCIFKYDAETEKTCLIYLQE